MLGRANVKNFGSGNIEKLRRSRASEIRKTMDRFAFGGGRMIMGLDGNDRKTDGIEFANANEGMGMQTSKIPEVETSKTPEVRSIGNPEDYG
jgi:hypothetical protein